MSRPFASIDCAHRRPARYDERTSGPASTPRKPISSASCFSSTNSSGRTQRATGRCRGLGPQVLGDRDDVGSGVVQVLQRLADLGALLAHPEDEVRLRDQPGVASLRDHVERAVVAEGRADALEDARHRLDVVREDLRLRAEDLAEVSGLPEKSGTRISTPVPGLWRWISRMVSAYSQEPSSGRSSRATPVTVA